MAQNDLTTEIEQLLIKHENGEITDKQRQTWGTPFSRKGRK